VDAVFAVVIHGRLNVNVALNRPAYQSSTWNDIYHPYTFPARYANDGNSGTDIHGAPCACTSLDTNPWLAIDLLVPLHVAGISFTNTDDLVAGMSADRFGPARLRLSNNTTYPCSRSRPVYVYSLSSPTVLRPVLTGRKHVPRTRVVCTGLEFLNSYDFSPRCMECRRGLAMRILSVRLSVKRVNCDKTEEKSVTFLYHTKDPFPNVVVCPNECDKERNAYYSEYVHPISHCFQDIKIKFLLSYECVSIYKCIYFVCQCSFCCQIK